MNEEQVLRDILPPMLLPEEPDYLLFMAIAAGGGVLIFVLWYFFRRRQQKIVIVPAHETAMAELLELRSLMNPEYAALYAEKLSSVLRSYIEKCFSIPTTIQTTKEFFAGLHAEPNQTNVQLVENKTNLRSCLDQCDMAKFARMEPDKNSMEQMEEAVLHFIQVTVDSREGGK